MKKTKQQRKSEPGGLFCVLGYEPTVGMVLDLWTEKANDTVPASKDGSRILVAGQVEFDNF